MSGAAPASGSASRSARLRDYLAVRPGLLPELDGVRAVAILLVLGRHATLPFEAAEEPFLQLGPWRAGSLLVNGWTGVDLFFVLSGFLIGYHLVRRWRAGEGRRQLRRYVAKRLLRIVPAYYFVLLAVVAGAVPFHPLDRARLGARLLAHLAFLQDYTGSDIVVAFWSLGVEEKFYLVAPLVVVPLAARTGGRRYLPLALVFALSPLARWWTYEALGRPGDYATWFRELRSPFHLSLDGLVVGCAIALLYTDAPLWRRFTTGGGGRALLAGGLAGATALLAAAPLVDRVSALEAALVAPLVALAFGAVVLGVLASESPLHALLRRRELLFLSKISYSLYLVHMLFTEPLARALARLPGWSALDVDARFFVYLPLSALVAIGAATLVHYAVEKPFLLLKERL
jgi:peptidoglycan/LPS O-acetylase OafA/YrhL